MARHELNERLYAQLSRVAAALASPSRLEILDALAQAEQPVEALASAAGLTLANASQHLRVLREAQLVESRKQGLRVYYSLAGPEVFDLMRMLRSVAELRLAELDRIADTYLRSRDQLEPVGREELLERARAGEVLVIDVRPEAEFRAGHIPGAISLPLEELELRLSELPEGVEIVAYCRCPYCLLSYDAVDMLSARGRQARRLVDGFPEWRAEGLPVERTPASH